jgi:hypothetical protein
MKISLMVQPRAWIPIAMSLLAFTVAFGHLIMFGTAREVDEGTLAHIWQLLMVGQLPIIVFFAASRIPNEPKRALSVLALQIAALLVAMAPVIIFKM